MSEPISIDLDKYRVKKNRKGAGAHPVHYIKFEHDKDGLEDWEIRAYDIVHSLMKTENMTLEQVKFMIYDEFLDAVGKQLGI